MRLVRYAPQERVDLPDITAMSFLVLGEFRRHNRGLLLGPGSSAPAYDNFIVRGYEVEAQPVPDATVTVTLDPGSGGPLAFALGAEDLTVRIDSGQLLGGDDSAGNTEGNAVQTFDFTGQPVDTYRLQMRFVYQQGASDNRAFWDESVNSEFIAATDTRFLPALELGIAVSPSSLGDEWIPLADVVWGGATVSPGDITDLREFVFEGTAGSFSSPTQASAFADFDRGVARETVGVNEVYPALRALARQVQDLKGQDDTGEFNWYARPYGPFANFASQPFATGQTKTLRTLETVTYVIGDGTTTFGDFNNDTGLEDCLQHIEDMAASSVCPERITIRLRSHFTGGFIWRITTPHQINDVCTIEIGGEGDAFRGGQTTVSIDPGVTSTALDVTSGGLILRNIRSLAPTSDITVWASTGKMVLENCNVSGRDNGASTTPCIAAPNRGSRITNCEINGVLSVRPVTGVSPAFRQGLVIEQTFIEDGGILCEEAALESIERISIRDCRILNGENHGFGLRGAIEVVGGVSVFVENTTIVHAGDIDGFHARQSPGNNSVPGVIHIKSCVFGPDGTAGVHAVNGGANGADGTGWGVFIAGQTAGGAKGEHITIEGTRFTGYRTIDAGGAQLNEITGFTIRDCDFSLNGNNSGGGTRFDAISIQGVANNSENPGLIAGCRLHRWSPTQSERSAAIRTRNSDAIKVIGNYINGNNFDNLAVTGRTRAACRFEDGFYIGVHDNHFEGWEPDTTTSGCCEITGTTRYITIQGNTFRDNGGWCVDLSPGTTQNAIVSDNLIHVSQAAGNGIRFDSGNDHCSVNGNNIYLQGAARDGIDFGPATDHMCSGNRLRNATINVSSGTVYGVNSGPVLNYLT